MFTDRGVYRLGEEVHFKAILRSNTPDGHPAAARRARRSTSRVRDSQNRRVVDERTVTVNEWSSAEWTLTLPAEGALGNYSVAPCSRATRSQAPSSAPATDPDGDDEVP